MKQKKLWILIFHNNNIEITLVLQYLKISTKKKNKNALNKFVELKLILRLFSQYKQWTVIIT